MRRHMTRLISLKRGLRIAWLISQCYTVGPSPDLVISLDSSNPDGKPTSMYLGLSSSIPKNGSCPSSWEEGDRVALPRELNTVVQLKYPHRAHRYVAAVCTYPLLYSSSANIARLIPRPVTDRRISLNPPPSLVPGTGKPAEPVVEKTFIQKYWMPMLGLGLFLMAQMGPDKPAAASS